ncbi:MAG: type II toxin-antitoxin system RelB/DinJ family antitoxin [Clostridia bacterium]|nr:type II toxin-antitoxin system RelB/DinJ family antitoxin [Clostridia bacterium]
MANALVKDTNFNMRMNRQKKADLESLFGSLGMTLPEAVNIFFESSLLAGGLPFSVRLPRYNRQTEAAMQEAREILDGKVPAKSYGSARELFRELEDEPSC